MKAIAARTNLALAGLVIFVCGFSAQGAVIAGVDTDTLNIVSDVAADSIRLSLAPGDNSILQVEVSGASPLSFARSLFSSISIVGNDGDDTITLDQSNEWFANEEAISVDGGGQMDRIVASGGNMTLTPASLSAGGTISLANINRATLIGSPSSSSIISALSFTGSVSFYGGIGNDTFSGGSGNDFFFGGGGKDTVTGGAGLDAVIASADANMTLTNTKLTVGSDASTLSGIEAATLEGGAGANTLNASMFTGGVHLSGGGGADVLNGGPGSDVLSATWQASGLYGGGGSDSGLLEATTAGDTIAIHASSVYFNGGASPTAYSGLEALTVDAGDGVDQATIDSGVAASIVLLQLEPAVAAGDDATIDLGAMFFASGLFVDPGDPGSDWSATVDYGDGGGIQPLVVNGDKSFALSHLYGEAGSYTVLVLVTDSQGNIGQDQALVAVVPEPASAVLLSLGAMAPLVRRRRRR